MFLAEMSTVASHVGCKHGVDVSQDFVYLLMDAHVKVSRDLLCSRLESERLQFIEYDVIEYDA